VKIPSVFPDISAKLWEDAVSSSVEGMFQKFPDPELEADDFQNLISSCLSTGMVVSSKISGNLFQSFRKFPEIC